MTDHRLPRRTLLVAGLAAGPGASLWAPSAWAQRAATELPCPPGTTRGADASCTRIPQVQPTRPLPYDDRGERPPPYDPRGERPRQDPPRDDRYATDRPAPQGERRYDPDTGRSASTEGPAPPAGYRPSYPARGRAEEYSRGEIVRGASDFLGVTAEAAGAGVERVFRDNGRPTAYIAGEEGSGAVGVGLRYGKGLLYMKNRAPQTVYWQGPSIGWDFGGNGSRCFTLCYNLQYADMIYRRFPGVEGSAYLIGGLGVNYQRADEITLAPMRAGLGLRLGANVGYLSYSRRRHWVPF